MMYLNTTIERQDENGSLSTLERHRVRLKQGVIHMVLPMVKDLNLGIKKTFCINRDLTSFK